MKDPRALSNEDLLRIKDNIEAMGMHRVKSVRQLLDYVDLLHELILPITGIFLQRDQERMGWKQAGIPPTTAPEKQEAPFFP